MKHNIAKNATNVFVVTKIDSVDTYRYFIKLTSIRKMKSITINFFILKKYL